MTNLTLDEQKTINEMVCMHECGHAIMAALLNVQIYMIDLGIESEAFPGTHIDTNTFLKLPIEKKLDFYMAGYAAEEIYMNTVSGSHDHFARDIAFKIFHENIDDHILIDIEAAKKIMKFPFFKNRRIALHKERAVKILTGFKPCMGRLFNALSESGGILNCQQVTSVIYDQRTS